MEPGKGGYTSEFIIDRTKLELYYHTSRRQDGQYTIELAKDAASTYIESVKACIAQVIAIQEIQDFARSG